MQAEESTGEHMLSLTSLPCCGKENDMEELNPTPQHYSDGG